MPTSASARTHRRPRLRAAALLAAGLVVGACSGCGYVSGHHVRTPSPSAVARPPARPAVPSRFSGREFTARQVAAHFRAVTGDGLRKEAVSSSWQTLELARESGPRRYRLWDRYGHFSIEVLHSPGDGVVFTEDAGRPLRRAANGIYWKPVAGGGWYAHRFYGNVVLSWLSDGRTLDRPFHRLDAVLSTLGRPALAGHDRLPAGDTPCGSLAIRIAGSREGACRDGDRNITIVNRGHVLALSGYSIRVLQARIGTVIKASPYGARMKPRGAFVGVRFDVTNGASRPLVGVAYNARLRIGRRSFKRDFDASVRLSRHDPFPLAPGERGTAVIVFDVPTSFARRAIGEGALILPIDPNSDPVDTISLGVGRLDPREARVRTPASPARPAAPARPALPTTRSAGTPRWS